MARDVEIRPLRKEDDRSVFSCGQPDLDRFFHHYASQNQFKLHLAVTYVAVMDRRIVGFATVAAGSIERERLPDGRQRERLPAYPPPVLRIARLGVDSTARGLGWHRPGPSATRPGTRPGSAGPAGLRRGRHRRETERVRVLPRFGLFGP